MTDAELRARILSRSSGEHGASRREIRDHVTMRVRPRMVTILNAMLAAGELPLVKMQNPKGARPLVLFFSDPAHYAVAQAAAGSAMAQYRRPEGKALQGPPRPKKPKPTKFVRPKDAVKRWDDRPVDMRGVEPTVARTPAPRHAWTRPADYVSVLDPDRCSGWARAVAP